jgi:hypothetical protein
MMGGWLLLLADDMMMMMHDELKIECHARARAR